MKLPSKIRNLAFKISTSKTMTAEMTRAARIAEALLTIGAIRLSPDKPFKWASGWYSPIYCDNRLSLSFPEVRSQVKEGLLEIIRDKFPQVQAIAGVATAGIPQGALLAEALNLPFLYVRPKPKDHGMENLIEGKIESGQQVVVIEDLISTGGSSLKAVEALKDAGAKVLGMAAIFTYGFPLAEDNFKKAGVTLYTLSHYSALLEMATAKKHIPAEALKTLEEWRQAPDKWKQ